MSFFPLSGANIDFLDWELRWKTYTTKEALLTTRYVELVGKKKFAAAALHPEHETYVVHVGSVSSDALPSFSPLELDIHTSRKSQISGLIAEESLTKVADKYVDFTDDFSPDLAFKFSKHTGINDHAIELVDGQQPLWLVELETLKAYIKTNLANRFIR